MREIKFRGLTENGNWLVGYFTTYDGVSYIKSIERDQRFGGGIDVKPETVGQFTGLKDANGTDIYEGDIIREYIDDEMFILVMDWDAESTSFDLKEDDEFTQANIYWANSEKQMTIIGNIHEHPHLVELPAISRELVG